MNRIILPLVAFAFVQLVNGQTQACIDATIALSGNTMCTTAFATGTDASALCMGTCRDLFDAIINNCGAATGSTYSTVLTALCTGGNTGGACEAAVNSVSDACGDSLVNGDNSVCSGTCAAQFNAVVAACGSTTDSDLQTSIRAYNGLCNPMGDACAAATAALLTTDLNCDSDQVSASVLCNGACRTLANNLINACPADDEVVVAVREGINQLCGSGNMLKASGVITLLIVAISALIF